VEGLVNLVYHFVMPQGNCHSNQLKLQNLHFCGPISVVALPFQNGLQYRNSDFKRFNRMNFSGLCTILVKFSPVTSEFTLLTITSLVAIWQKSAYHTTYLRISWTYLDKLYRFGSRIAKNWKIAILISEE